MSEWMKWHEAVTRKPGAERAIVLTDEASQEILKDLGVEFQEVKFKK